MGRDDNVVGYWGQNSYGASNGADTANHQKNLGAYCDDDTVDTFPISFLTVFFSDGGLPQLNLANICNGNDQEVFPGSQLPNCQFLEADIKKCQEKGKTVTLSMGGATGGNAFTDDNHAREFATQIWNLFLGGKSDTRPFGAAQLDGIDLDIEGGSGKGYVAFVNQLRDHFKSADKKYYVTAAPQCPYPDAILGEVLDGADIDAVYIQFYNNYCSVTNYNDPNSWNYESWNTWATTKAPNKDVKLYIGAPGAPGGANPGSYVDAATLGKIATETRSKYPKNFGTLAAFSLI
ncbi:glycoside hydrolase [Auricularia subglabra TFB-10046 SS5]|nr:glycoside hydrolase [Auricularia subglabra TFB-10046 SS5]